MTMAKKPNTHQHKSKYPESVAMLKTEEGQLNAVYACYGSAMKHGQLFEKELSNFLSIHKLLTNEESSPSEIPSTKTNFTKQTIGQLLCTLNQKISIDDAEIYSLLIEARDKRNMLAHEYFLLRDKLFETTDGRMKLLHELCSIEREIKIATNLVSGMRVGMESTLNGMNRAGFTGGSNSGESGANMSKLTFSFSPEALLYAVRMAMGHQGENSSGGS